MKKLFFCLLLIVVYSQFLSCGEIDKKADTKLIKGIKHVYNTAIPSKGKLTLNLKKILTIEPGKGEAEIRDLFFYDHVSDQDGNIYLIDGKSVKIHKFNPRGKYIKSFLDKGQGPGEFGNYPRVQFSGNIAFISNSNERKIARYTTDGKFLKEFKFKKYYYSLHMVDNEKFIGTVNKYLDDKRTKFIKYLGIYTLDEQNPVKLFEAENAGKFLAYFDNRSIVVIPNPGIYKDVIYTFDSHTKKIYISFNKDYTIYEKNLKGTTELVIHKDHKNPTLKHSDKVDIVNTFGTMPASLRKAIIDALPDKMCAIESLDVLSNGYILVRSVIGYQKVGFDIFSRRGEYVYLIDLPEGINLEKIKFSNGVLSGIENREDTPVYHMYKIESLPNVF
ncbi:MAG: hypothetical protein KAT34_14825 [Candidatus Aminicenantes bacterium]|nr:hypothetical protein [Candidatus Aminicenantes bacterium]